MAYVGACRTNSVTWCVSRGTITHAANPTSSATPRYTNPNGRREAHVALASAQLKGLPDELDERRDEVSEEHCEDHEQQHAFERVQEPQRGSDEQDDEDGAEEGASLGPGGLGCDSGGRGGVSRL